jgi:hypothetical protein
MSFHISFFSDEYRACFSFTLVCKMVVVSLAKVLRGI